MESSSDPTVDEKAKSKKSGISRSLIRKIGSTLPLSSTQRPKFELLPNGARLINSEQHTLFSLSDICQLIEIPDVFQKSLSSNNLKAHIEDDKTSNTTVPETPTSPAPQNVEMVSKITALEDELLQLRSQIAMLVSNQTKQQEQMSASFSSMTAVADEPDSTPAKSSIPPPPPLLGSSIPPPPPLPLGVSMKETPKVESAIELIRRRKQERGNSLPERPKSVLSMSDVLKDLHKVKLKSVSRSPGGTPLNAKTSSKKESATGDPAAFIAAALRKKFAHRQNCSDSPDGARDLGLRQTSARDKEWEESPPKFGQHLLKKRPPPVPTK